MEQEEKEQAEKQRKEAAAAAEQAADRPIGPSEGPREASPLLEDGSTQTHEEVWGAAGSQVVHVTEDENMVLPEIPVLEPPQPHGAPEDGDAYEQDDPAMVHNPDWNEETEGLSKEELGAMVASRWTGGAASHSPTPAAEEDQADAGIQAPPTEWADFSSSVPDEDPALYHEEELSYEHGTHDHLPHDDDEFHDHSAEEYAEEDDDDGDVQDDSDLQYQHQSDHEEVEDDEPPSTSAMATAGLGGVICCSGPLAFMVLSQSLQFPSPNPVKADFRKATQKLQDHQSRITDLESKLSRDYGPSGEFAAFEDKYEYEICPYKQATQKEGHQHSRLGNWKGFGRNYTAMLYDAGDTCWNGPQRSMQVTMICGLENRILSVDEPSRCEYAAEMATPAVCFEEEAELLAEQLAEKEQEAVTMAGHDEL
eukprot:SM000030S11311  [mRNA]  locus=s30:4120:7428:- [translate_table: standard]